MAECSAAGCSSGCSSAESTEERKPFFLERYFKTPHTVTLMIIVGAALLWAAFRAEGHDSGSNVRRGVYGMVVAFLAFAMVQFPDSYFRRPHRIVWRVVMGVSLLYMLSLIFLLFQTLDQARSLLGIVDSRLGVPLPERNYASDCRLYTPEDPVSRFRNVRDAVVDEFFIGHAIGWWAKVIILRDVRMALVASVLFEGCELSLRHILPNFYECWWDHLILDLLLTNTTGIIVGYYTLRLLRAKRYNWLGQFGPEEYTPFSWGVFTSWKRFLYCIFLVFMTEMLELGVFSLKALLWIPPQHPLVIGRLFVVGLVACPALREYYEFMVNSRVKSLGPNVWILAAIATLEGLLTFKWTRDLPMPRPTPTPVKVAWAAALTAIALFGVTFFPLRHRRQAFQKHVTSSAGNKRQ